MSDGSRENFERMTSLAKGDKGDKGETGARGLSRVQGRAVVILFVLAVLLSGADLFWSAHLVNSATAAQQRQQAAQQRQGQMLEQKLCTTLGKLAVLKPPGGSPVNNPSRAYDQDLHAALDQLGPDLGCLKSSPGT
jgi:hypothetical protein